MKALTSLALSVALVAAATPNARAGTLVCGGTVEQVAYHVPGRVMLRLSGMNTFVFICSTDSEWVVPGSQFGNTTVSACKAIYATFLAARATGATINGLYLDGDQVPASCASFAPWVNVSVRHFAY